MLPEWPLMNAFEFFHNDLMGNILDFLLKMSTVTDLEKGAYSYASVEKAVSVDEEYVEKLLAKSLG